MSYDFRNLLKEEFPIRIMETPPRGSFICLWKFGGGGDDARAGRRSEREAGNSTRRARITPGVDRGVASSRLDSVSVHN